MKAEVAKILLNIKSIALNISEPFTWSSGIISPIYCDNRLLLSYPQERDIIIEHMSTLLKDLEFDVIAGTSTAGIPWAAWVAMKLNKPMVYVRKTAKDHGLKHQIEGRITEGQKIVVIDDLISTGGSALHCVDTLRKAGGIVTDVVAIFTYNLKKADSSFEEANCTLRSVCDFNTLIHIASEQKYITQEEKEKALLWSDAPEQWGRGDT